MDELIEQTALRYKLQISVVRAVCYVESRFNTWAWNPEPQYRYLWDVRRKAPFRALTAAEILAERPPSDFHSLAADADQEWWGQQASWGLMQVMGGVAREYGFTGPYLTELLDPAVGLDVGCRVLNERMSWSGLDLAAALASYNGGKGGNQPGGRLRNQPYVDKVMAAMRDRRFA